MQFSEGVHNPPYCVRLLHSSLRCNIKFQRLRASVQCWSFRIWSLLLSTKGTLSQMKGVAKCCYWQGLSSVAASLSLNWVAVYLDDLMVQPPPQPHLRPIFFFLSPEKQRHCVGHKGTVCSLMRSCRDRACGNTDALGNTTGLGNFSRRNPKNRTVKITLGGQTAERRRDRAALSSGFTVWNTQDPKG